MESATSYHFNYLTVAAYEANVEAGKEGFAGAARAPTGVDPGIGSGSTTLFPSQSVAGLKAETAYRYRVVAQNEAGPTVGPERTFVTGIEMTLKRNFSYCGERHSYLSAGCPAPKGFPGATFPLAHISFAFAGRRPVATTLTRSCKARG